MKERCKTISEKSKSKLKIWVPRIIGLTALVQMFNLKLI